MKTWHKGLQDLISGEQETFVQLQEKLLCHNTKMSETNDGAISSHYNNYVQG